MFGTGLEQNYFNHPQNICFVAIQYGSKSNNVSGLNFCWLGNANYVKFIEQSVMCTKKLVLVKKYL